MHRPRRHRRPGSPERPFVRTPAGPHPSLLLAALLLAVVLGPASVSAQSSSGGWRGGVGLGLGLSLDGVEQDVDALGLAGRAAVTRRTPGRPGFGVQWAGAWFRGRYATETRFLLSAVVEAPLAGTPLVVRAGPGVGMLTVVDVDLPPDGTVGDALVAIGDTGSWGLTLGVGGRLPWGPATLEPLADLVWQRADGRGALTFIVGGNLSLGG